MLVLLSRKSYENLLGRIYLLGFFGLPGHLYQTVYTNSSDLPLIRNLFSSPGYTEGWATYVEYYAFGISGLEKNLAQTLSLNGSASLGLYAYVDMAVNYNGWDRTDVEEFFVTV